MTLAKKMEAKGVFITDWYSYKGDKRTLLNNCIESQIGKHIINQIKDDDGKNYKNIKRDERKKQNKLYR